MAEESKPCPELTLVRLLEERIDQAAADVRWLKREVRYNFELRTEGGEEQSETDWLTLDYRAVGLSTQNEADMLTWAHSPDPIPVTLRGPPEGEPVGLLTAHARVLLLAVLRHRQRSRQLRAVQLAARLV